MRWSTAKVGVIETVFAVGEGGAAVDDESVRAVTNGRPDESGRRVGLDVGARAPTRPTFDGPVVPCGDDGHDVRSTVGGHGGEQRLRAEFQQECSESGEVDGNAHPVTVANAVRTRSGCYELAWASMIERNRSVS